MANPDDTINVVTLLKAAHAKLDAGSLGSLVALLSDELYGGSKTSTLDMLRTAELEDCLWDAEFIEKLGKERLKSKQIIKLAFISGTSFSDIVNKLCSALTAGAINLQSDSALAALHGGIEYCRFAEHVEAKVLLLSRLVGEMDSFRQAGEFLRLFLACTDCKLDGDDVIPVVRGVLANRDVRDLGGSPGDLLQQLPEHIADDVRDEFLNGKGEGSEDDEEDADEDGNLKGFVVDDDEEEYDDENDEDDDDEGSGDGNDDEDDDEDDDSDDEDRRHGSKRGKGRDSSRGGSSGAAHGAHGQGQARGEASGRGRAASDASDFGGVAKPLSRLRRVRDDSQDGEDDAAGAGQANSRPVAAKPAHGHDSAAGKAHVRNGHRGSGSGSGSGAGALPSQELSSAFDELLGSPSEGQAAASHDHSRHGSSYEGEGQLSSLESTAYHQQAAEKSSKSKKRARAVSDGSVQILDDEAGAGGAASGSSSHSQSQSQASHNSGHSKSVKHQQAKQSKGAAKRARYLDLEAGVGRGDDE